MLINCLDNPAGERRDVVIATVPWTGSAIPLMAPAVLKSIVEKADMTCLAVDLNVEIYNMTKFHPQRESLIRFFFDEYVDDEIDPWLRDMFQSITDGILSWHPKVVGLSLFSYVCQHTAKWLAYYIRRTDPTVKIIFGGAGCLKTFTGPSEYIEDLLNQKLIDYHVRGDGEHALYELLTGNDNFAGINNVDWKELSRDDLARLPIPNYDDYDFDQYEKQALPLIGSRGCVRQCTFCDYIANWKKFQWRTADDIFEEMLHQYQRYGVRYFKFQDALTNGNMKEFTRLTEMLTQHNREKPDQSFRWSGFYIFRENTPSSDREWELVAGSGAEILVVGIENLNERIRYEIGKKFSNAAIDYHLDQALKYNIQIHMLNITGYISETRDDIEFAKEWLRTHTRFQPILHIEWGATLGIFPNTYLYNNMDKLGIIKVDRHPQSWINPSIGSTPQVRAQWVKELNVLGKELGYRIGDQIENHFLLETLMNA
jgi:radical SAM superfamily enzyme YgiQ (UPF0313 family)